MANLRYKGIQQWSYRTFIESGRHSIREIAEILGYDPDHLHGLCNGTKGYWPPDCMRPLISYLFQLDRPDATQDAYELVRMLIPEEKPPQDITRPLERELWDVVGAFGHFSECVTKALDDGHVTPKEAVNILREFDLLRVEEAQARTKLEQIANKELLQEP